MQLSFSILVTCYTANAYDTFLYWIICIELQPHPPSNESNIALSYSVFNGYQMYKAIQAGSALAIQQKHTYVNLKQLTYIHKAYSLV